MKIASDMQYELGQDKVNYFPEFDVKDDKTLLGKLKNIAHSTFDSSKFTVMGNPVITNDGVASGFDSTSSINTGFKLSNLYNKPWTIKTRTIYKQTDGAAYHFGTTLNSASNGKQWFAKGNFGINNDAQNIYFTGQTEGGNEGYKIAHIFDEGFFKDGDIIDLILSFDLTTYTLKYAVNNGNVITLGTWTPETGDKNLIGINTNNTIWINCIGADGNQYQSNMSSDLSHFSIIIDGIPVFNGNKTGIDIIKPDNYTVVGNPVISEDGIVRNDEENNGYITYVQRDYSNVQKIKFKSRFQYFAPTSESGLAALPNLRITTGASRQLHLRGGAIDDYIANITPENKILLNDGDWINVTLEYSKNHVFAEVKKDDGTVAITNVETNLEFGTITCQLLNFFAPSTTYLYKNGIVDLNLTQLFVDDELIWQPCLKIPYTLSKTGSKIVDAIYRNRVQSFFEEFGYNEYFTAGDEDFTLPTCKGDDVVSSYRNGVNYYEQKANRVLEQGGSCVANEHVNFLKPYTDENYVLSVPYSEKTKTGFTPTVSGDWISKGQIMLDTTQTEQAVTVNNEDD